MNMFLNYCRKSYYQKKASEYNDVNFLYTEFYIVDELLFLGELPYCKSGDLIIAYDTEKDKEFIVNVAKMAKSIGMKVQIIFGALKVYPFA